MKRLVAHRWLVLLGAVVVLAALAPGLQTSLEPDHSLGVWFLDDDPNLKTYEDFQEAFGNDEVVVVRVEPSTPIFDPDVLEVMADIGQRIGDIEGVEQVHSLLSALVAFDSEGPIDGVVVPTSEDIPTTEEGIERWVAEAEKNPLIAGRFIDKSEDGFVLVVQMESSEDFDDMRPAILKSLEAELADTFADWDYQRGGVGVIYQALNDLTERDFGLFLGLGYLLMFLLLFFVFRSIRLVGAALFVIAGATVVSFGVMGWLGIQVNMITVLLPTLIAVLGIADAMHFPVAYRRVRLGEPGLGDDEALVKALREASVPCVMTTLTTMAGFLALSASSLAGVRQLGIFAAIGVGAAFLISLPIMAVALHGRSVEEVRQLPRVKSFLDAVRRWVTQRPKVVGLAMALMAAVAAIGAFKVSVDTFTLGFLPADHDVVTDDERLEEELGPYIPLEWTYQPTDEGVESAAMLRRAARFAERAEEHEATGQAMHPEQLYVYVASLVFPFTEEGEELDEELVAQLQDLFDQIGGEERSLMEVLGFVSSDEELGRVTIPVRMMSAAQLAATIEEIEEMAVEEFDASAEVRPTGYLPLYATVIHHIVEAQIRSLAIAVVIILLLMTLWLRSVRLALISLIPNLFPVLVMLGVMGYLGMHVDAVTAVVAAIVIGVAIDDTVHFLHAWRKAESDGKDWEGCLERAMEEVGPAIAITTVVLVGGFSVLLLAELVTVVYFGLLTVVAAAAALVGEFFLLPLLLRPFAKSGEEK